MSQDLTTTAVGQIVAADFRRAAVFDAFGIDFCCHGRATLAEACGTAGAELTAVIAAIDAIPAAPADRSDAALWPIPQLIDHIEEAHHAYVRAASPRIAQRLARLVEAHGARHPELVRVAAEFEEVRAELEQHMVKEERILFPYVRDLAERPQGCGAMQSPFGTVANPIRMMEEEHTHAGAALAAIRALTSGYTTPLDGCTTYRVTMDELQEFEWDLHRHIHLENNVLFPAAVRLEESACLASLRPR